MILEVLVGVMEARDVVERGLDELEAGDADIVEQQMAVTSSPRKDFPFRTRKLSTLVPMENN